MPWRYLTPKLWMIFPIKCHRRKAQDAKVNLIQCFVFHLSPYNITAGHCSFLPHCNCSSKSSWLEGEIWTFVWEQVMVWMNYENHSIKAELHEALEILSSWKRISRSRFNFLPFVPVLFRLLSTGKFWQSEYFFFHNIPNSPLFQILWLENTLFSGKIRQSSTLSENQHFFQRHSTNRVLVL